MQKSKVFKFGGASVRNAEAVRNMYKIINAHSPDSKNIVVVVSAMGKTTNRLEEVYFNFRNELPYLDVIQEIKEYHINMISQLCPGNIELEQSCYQLFLHLQSRLESIDADTSLDEGYDRIIPFGEILSTHIINGYMIGQKMNVLLVEAKNYIKTDRNWRDASIDWNFSCSLIRRDLPPILENKIVLTQGFVGGTIENQFTTLGREGSDYTAAILANCLESESVTIWKDVPGVLNADPKIVKDAKLFSRLSYHEASEMTFYGASVIHPRTIKPLANRYIPLYVRSFLQPDKPGTVIDDKWEPHQDPTIIYKFRQVLISFGVKDFTFIEERNLGLIFHTLSELNLKINVMQRSAITFSVCIDQRDDKITSLKSMLNDHFSITFNEGLTLLTIKNYSNPLITDLIKNNEVLLEQRTRHTVQILYKEPSAC